MIKKIQHLVFSVVFFCFSSMVLGEGLRYLKPIKTTWIVWYTSFSKIESEKESSLASELAQAKALGAQLLEELRFRDQVKLLAEMPNLGAWVLESETSPDLTLKSLQRSDVVVIRDIWEPAHQVLKMLSPGSTKLDWALRAIQLSENRGMEGAGVKVGVVDSGTDLQHPSLIHALKKAKNFLPNTTEDQDVEDELQHGVSVASLIFGLDSGAGFRGVAPGAHYYSAKVCESRGCAISAIVRALDWSITEGLDALNLSLAVLNKTSTPGEEQAFQQSRRLMTEAIDRAVRSGITVVAASGNESDSQVAFPGSLNQVISVGSVNTQIERSRFSNYGKNLTLVAPGEGLPAGKMARHFALTDLNIEVLGAKFRVPVEWDIRSPATFLQYKGGVSWLSFPSVKHLNKASVRDAVVFLNVLPDDEEKSIQLLQMRGALAVVLLSPPISLVPGVSKSDTSSKARSFALPTLRLDFESSFQLAQLQSKNSIQAVSLTLTPTFYGSVRGTSFATPLVIGAVAQVKALNAKIR
ncbi:MAG: S8 family serine peptidase, partial [Bdellovibrio sp.]